MFSTGAALKDSAVFSVSFLFYFSGANAVGQKNIPTKILLISVNIYPMT